MKKVLVVDDSTFMRMILKNILGKEYDISEAADGEEALEKYRTERPDLVLLDIVMPDKDGEYVLREIRGIDQSAKVIMVTAVGQDPVIQECKELGALDYIVKPFEEKLVRSAVDGYLK